MVNLWSALVTIYLKSKKICFSIPKRSLSVISQFLALTDLESGVEHLKNANFPEQNWSGGAVVLCFLCLKAVLLKLQCLTTLPF